MSKQTKYMRTDTKGACLSCPRENVDIVCPTAPRLEYNDVVRWATGAPVIARHLHRIEEYGPRGASPSGFCPGSLHPAKERAPAPVQGRAKRSR